jgi:hypothetical protein
MTYVRVSDERVDTDQICKSVCVRDPQGITIIPESLMRLGLSITHSVIFEAASRLTKIKLAPVGTLYESRAKIWTSIDRLTARSA